MLICIAVVERWTSAFFHLAPKENQVFLDGQVRRRGRTGNGGDSRQDEGMGLVQPG